jgi:hypothetical protein
VLLLQLLQPDLYPEDDAAALAAYARAQVLIFVKTVSRAKAAVKYRDEQAQALAHGRAAAAARLSVISRIAALALKWGGGGVRGVARRVAPLLLLLLAVIALCKFRRGGFVVARRLLSRYQRQ